MMRTVRIPLFCLIAVALCSCSIYRNKGRDQFEARAAGQVKTEIEASSLSSANENNPEDLASSCWIQGRQEPLWSFPEDARIEVRPIENQKMVVCLKSPLIDPNQVLSADHDRALQ